MLILLAAYILTACGSRSSPTATSILTDPTGQAISQDMPAASEIISGTTKVLGQAFASGAKSTACPKLDSQLSQVLASDDPMKTAGQLGLSLLDQKIQVVIVLKGEDTAFLVEYDVNPGSQSGSELQAYASLNRLCDLSNRDEVLAIRLPTAVSAP